MVNFKNRGFDWLIISCFLTSFLLSLSEGVFAGVLFILMGLFLVWRQEKAPDLTEVPPEIEYAGFWKRAGSLLIDGGIKFLIFIILFLMFGKNIYDDLNYGLYMLIGLFFVDLYPLKRWGQSPGKMVMGIRVVKYDFSGLTWSRVLLRFCLEVLNTGWYLVKAFLIMDGITTAGMILVGAKDSTVFPANFFKTFSDKLLALYGPWSFSELAILLFNRKRRALHDYLANTVVIVSRKSTPAWTWWVIAASVFMSAGHVWFFVTHKDFMLESHAAQGDTQSQRYLGFLYEKGSLGYPKDYTLARQWYEKAAAQDDKGAEGSLGEIYEKGLGVPVDGDKAVEWFEKAAAQGDNKAEYYLGEMYEKGLAGPVDRDKAIEWYSRAAKDGNYRAKKALKNLLN